jgi:hypothetical protein
MYLLYIDDSGSIDKKDDPKPQGDENGNSLYFVLAGVLIDASKVNTIEKKLFSLKSECLCDKYDEIKFSKKVTNVFKCVNNKSCCNGEPTIILNTNNDICIGNIKKCYRQRFISGCQTIDANCFSVFTNKFEFYKHSPHVTPGELYEECFKRLISLVFNYLKNKNINKPIVIFIDNTDKTKNNRTYKSYEKIIREPDLNIFTAPNILPLSLNICNSYYTLGIQIADLLAGSIAHAYEKKDYLYSNFWKDKFIQENKEYFGYSLFNVRNL